MMPCSSLRVERSETKQSQPLRLLRTANNDIYLLCVIYQMPYEWLWKLVEEV